MDFEVIDNTHGDSLGKGDIVKDDDGQYHHLKSEPNDEGDIITFDTYNLSTGDEDTFLADPAENYDLHRSY